MKGSNTLVLNEATMIAALQMYLDAQFAVGQAPSVESVMYTNGDYRVGVVEREGL